MPHRLVGSDGEDLESSVGVGGDVGLAHVAAEGVPSAPSVVGCGLPDVPHRLVGSDGEDLESAVGVAAGSNLRDLTAE